MEFLLRVKLAYVCVKGVCTDSPDRDTFSTFFFYYYRFVNFMCWFSFFVFVVVAGMSLV